MNIGTLVGSAGIAAFFIGLPGLVLWVLWSFAVAAVAARQGRAQGNWLLLSLFTSPLVSAAILIIAGPANANLISTVETEMRRDDPKSKSMGGIVVDEGFSGSSR